MTRPTKTVTTRRARHLVEVVEPEMAAMLRRKSAAERLQIGHSLWRHARESMDAHLRSIHPEWSEGQRRQEIARRMADGS